LNVCVILLVIKLIMKSHKMANIIRIALNMIILIIFESRTCWLKY